MEQPYLFSSVPAQYIRTDCQICVASLFIYSSKDRKASAVHMEINCTSPQHFKIPFVFQKNKIIFTSVDKGGKSGSYFIALFLFW